MKNLLRLIAGIFLTYSLAGIVLHALANLENFGHQCELLLVPADANHLQVFTVAAAIAAVLFLIAGKIGKKQLRKSL